MRLALPARTASLLATCALAVGAAVGPIGCATAHIDPALYSAKKIVLASVYARKNIYLENVNGLAPGLYDNEYGGEVVEMELGDTEGALGDLFGADVIPAGRAMQTKAYGRLPEAQPPEEFTRINDMIAVDIDAPAAQPALGALAQALGADAAVVLRHEFALTRDNFEVNAGVTAFDRCSILVVDASGKVLWDDVVVVRIPAVELMGGALGVGLNALPTGNWADEARQLARRCARDAIDQLERRFRSARKSAPAAPTTPAPAPAPPPPAPPPPPATTTPATTTPPSTAPSTPLDPATQGERR